MKELRFLVVSACLMLCAPVLMTQAAAQTVPSGAGETQAKATDSASFPLVTAIAAGDHIRFTALTMGSRMRLEIISQAGDTLYDSALRPGNLIEWELAGQQGSRLSDGFYGCIVTVEELSGRVTYRRGVFRLLGGKAAFDSAAASRFEAAADGSGETSISILGAGDRFPFTFVGHDGTDARIESTAGGLILHAGWFYAGASDQAPHMRLTPEGNLGIGVHDPQAKLDVAGMIRASDGFQFSDGTVLKMEGGFPVLVSDAPQATGGIAPGSYAVGNSGSRSGKITKPIRILAAGGEVGRVNGTEGVSNTFYGQAAGNGTMAGLQNSFFGVYPGYYNTTGSWNSFFGYGAGFANTTGQLNSFVGSYAGYFNTTGSSNSLFGQAAGTSNTTGSDNSFFGFKAGYSNTHGSYNSFVGRSAGYFNTTGAENSFFGYWTGYANTTGSFNAFYGDSAGGSNTTGGYNSYVGESSGQYTTTGNYNSFLGNNTGRSMTAEHHNSLVGALSDGAVGITNATALGYRAKVSQSNSLVLGSINGINSATADTNVGIGITNPERRFHVAETGLTSIRGVAFDQYSADQFASVFILRKSRNASPGAHSILQNGDALFNFTGQGSDGTKFVDVARIRMEIDGTPGVSDMPGRMTFWTTPDGAASTTERMRIDSLGNVGIGTSTPAERLHVVGNIRATGSIFSQPGPETEVPDYVFEPDYHLMPVEELQRYLEREKHLPNIPNAAEIKDIGLNLADFQMKLLEKIEELTLYAMQQARMIREQQITLKQKDAEISDVTARLTARAEQGALHDARLAAVEQVLGQLARKEEKK
jgi:trimeric autotransporter adhesin